MIFPNLSIVSSQISELSKRPTLARTDSPIAMANSVNAIPLPYRLFFLYVEPLSTILGAYYAHLEPLTYLMLTDSASAPVSVHTIPKGTSIVLTQLANLYFLFALNEGLVLRSTTDLRVWRTLLFGLLVADFGHLYSCKNLGLAAYWQFWTWNAIDWGNIAFVYCGAAMRMAFLLGVGLKGAPEAALRKRKSR